MATTGKRNGLLYSLLNFFSSMIYNLFIPDLQRLYCWYTDTDTLLKITQQTCMNTIKLYNAMTVKHKKLQRKKTPIDKWMLKNIKITLRDMLKSRCDMAKNAGRCLPVAKISVGYLREKSPIAESKGGCENVEFIDECIIGIVIKAQKSERLARRRETLSCNVPQSSPFCVLFDDLMVIWKKILMMKVNVFKGIIKLMITMTWIAISSDHRNTTFPYNGTPNPFSIQILPTKQHGYIHTHMQHHAKISRRIILLQYSTL